jgi:hypothetical protein|tara:strand:+ start:314 stop:691 length:378 start_codon:yes stop_codon:yes gene_type:complete
MSIKLLVLKSGEDVVADVQEMMVEDKVVGYFLNKPCVVKMSNYTPIQDEETDENSQKNGFQVRFYPWVPLAKDPVIPLTLEWVVTMVEPMEKLTKLYVEQILNYGKQRTETDQSDSTDESADSDQ